MALKFHSLQIHTVKSITSDCISISFIVPKHLNDAFTYNAGQYITLRFNIQGQDVRRSYSLCTAPSEGKLPTVAVKSVENGIVSNHIINNLKDGDFVDVLQPDGIFTPKLEKKKKKSYILFAGGSGITPIISIVKELLLSEPQSHIKLIYGNKNVESIIFYDELNDIASKFSERFEISHVLEDNTNLPEAKIGMLDQIMVADIFDALEKDKRTVYFICGPTPMMESVKSVLENRSIKKKYINVEFFVNPNQKTDKKPTLAQSSGACLAKVVLDGDTHEIEMDETTILLDGVLGHGLDAPYSCQGGVCTSCKAKVLEGEVDMDEVFGISDSEIKKGYILTCSARPKGENLKISYDE